MPLVQGHRSRAGIEREGERHGLRRLRGRRTDANEVPEFTNYKSCFIFIFQKRTNNIFVYWWKIISQFPRKRNN